MGKAAKFLYLLAGRLKVLGLLDEYSGAAAAYSLRSLSASTTNVVKVRRSGDDAELDFTASQVSGGALTAWVVAGGGTEDGFVVTWYDQSGNGNNATQATAASQPKIVSSGTLVTENGKAALDFDGADFLAVNDNANLRNSSMSFFMAFNNNTAGRADWLSCGSSQAYTSNNYILGTNSQTSGSFFGRTPETQYQPAITDIQNLFSFIADNSTTSINWYVNAVSKISLTSNTIGTDDTTGLFIGCSLSIGSPSSVVVGVFQELIIYNSNQSSNRTGIEANINDYYNIYP
jgi:hypothetical protein